MGPALDLTNDLLGYHPLLILSYYVRIFKHRQIPTLLRTLSYRKSALAAALFHLTKNSWGWLSFHSKRLTNQLAIAPTILVSPRSDWHFLVSSRPKNGSHFWKKTETTLFAAPPKGLTFLATRVPPSSSLFLSSIQSASRVDSKVTQELNKTLEQSHGIIKNGQSACVTASDSKSWFWLRSLRMTISDGLVGTNKELTWYWLLNR